MNNNILPTALSIGQTMQTLGLGRTKLYELIGSGVIPAKKLGKRTLILRSDIEQFLSELETYPTKGGIQ